MLPRARKARPIALPLLQVAQVTYSASDASSSSEIAGNNSAGVVKVRSMVGVPLAGGQTGPHLPRQ